MVWTVLYDVVYLACCFSCAFAVFRLFRSLGRGGVAGRVFRGCMGLISLISVVIASVYLFSENVENQYTVRFLGDRVYEYEKVDIDDYEILYTPRVGIPRKVKEADFSTPVYVEDSITVSVDDEYTQQIRFKEFIKADLVVFKYDGRDYLYKDEKIDREKVTISVQYENGDSMEVGVRFITVTYGDSTANVIASDGGYTFNLVVPIGEKTSDTKE